MQKVKWGVLGVARIATVKVIPAMQRGGLCEIAAIASRHLARAEDAARKLGIAKAYGSYDELLADPAIEAVYIPLPNHLHVPLSIRAAEAGKHILCEKPIAMSASEARELLAVRSRTGVLVGEAFMVQVHPQWQRTVELIRAGRIGKLLAARASYGYHNPSPENIRNILAYGGGGLMDIGCYPVKISRMVFGEEPRRVSATMVRDPQFGTDVLTSAVMEFPSGQSVFTCGTQEVPNQSMEFIGSKGRLWLDVPFNAIPNEISRLRIDDGSSLTGAGIVTEELAPCDQYTLQGDAFSHAIREHGRPPVPLEDAIQNMAVIDALFLAAESGKWEKPESVAGWAGAR